MIAETTVEVKEVKEGLITRYNYEIAPTKAKLTLYVGLRWVEVTSHVTIGKLLDKGLKLRTGWRNLHPDQDPWTVLFEERGKKLIFVDVRAGKPTPKPDIAPRSVRLIDYVSWQGRAMLKIDDAEVGTIFLQSNTMITDAGLDPVPTVTKIDGWTVTFERKAGEVKLLQTYPTPIAAPVVSAPPVFKPLEFPLMLPAPIIAGLLPEPRSFILIDTLPAPSKPQRAAKSRRYARQLPTKSTVGENAYAFTSARWLDVPRAERHKIMNGLDPLIEVAILYSIGKATLSGLSAEWDVFRRKMITVRSVTARDITRPGAHPMQEADTVYARQVADSARERAQALKQLVKDWLNEEIEPTSGEFVGPTHVDGTRFTYQLTGMGERHGLKIMLWSPLLRANQVSETISTRDQAQPAVESLWRRYDKLAERMVAETARRDPAVREYVPDLFMSPKAKQYTN